MNVYGLSVHTAHVILYMNPAATDRHQVEATGLYEPALEM